MPFILHKHAISLEQEIETYSNQSDIGRMTDKVLLERCGCFKKSQNNEKEQSVLQDAETELKNQ